MKITKVFLFAFYRTLFDHSNVLLPTFNMHIEWNLNAELFKIIGHCEIYSFILEVYNESLINTFNLEKDVYLTTLMVKCFNEYIRIRKQLLLTFKTNAKKTMAS